MIITSINQVTQVAKQLKETTSAILNFEPGNGTSFKMFMVYDEKEKMTHVGISNFGSAYSFNLKDYLHPSYVSDKLGLNTSDAGVISSFFEGIGKHL